MDFARVRGELPSLTLAPQPRPCTWRPLSRTRRSPSEDAGVMSDGMSIVAVHAIIRRAGGLAATHELLRFGVGRRQLAALVASGGLVRPRQGWYVNPDTHDSLVCAVRVGGRLAAISAAEYYGLATPHAHPLHVHVPRRDSRLRTAHSSSIRLSDDRLSTTVIHRGPVRPADTQTRLCVGIIDCLVQVALSEDEDITVACFDSALHTGVVAPSALQSMVRRLPSRLHHLPSIVDGRSDSYLESVARRKLARAGIRCQLQVGVLGERWIDILIGDRLAIELDGASKYQGLPDAEIARRVDSDRVRDAFLEALGYHVIRLSYRMVVDDWPATLSLIQAVMDRGDHLRR